MHIQYKTPPDKITFEIINKDVILDFLEWLQNDRKCGSRTRSQRYAAIRSFFKYMLYVDPVHLSQWKIICSLKQAREKKDTIKYLTVNGVKCLLEQINMKTRKGRRDLTMLSLLYNSGARVQELINLTPLSVRRSKPYYIELIGKGSKKRVVPIEETMMKLLISYMEENRLNMPGMEHHPLFFNAWGSKLTNPGITYILQKYVVEAKKVEPELVPQNISSHILTHIAANRS